MSLKGLFFLIKGIVLFVFMDLRSLENIDNLRKIIFNLDSVVVF